MVGYGFHRCRQLFGKRGHLRYAVIRASNARDNMETTGSKVNEILFVLNQAIEDSKSVDQVNALTKEILSISTSLTFSENG